MVYATRPMHDADSHIMEPPVVARGTPRRRAPGAAARDGRRPTPTARRGSTSTASATSTPIRSTAPTTSRRSCSARTSWRRARSSKPTGRARSTCSGSRASSCSTRSRARTCLRIERDKRSGARGRDRAGSAARRSSTGARSTRGCCRWSSSRSATWPPRSRSTREAIDARRGRADDRPVLPARSLAEPRRARTGVGDGGRSGRADRAARRGRGRQRDEPGVLRERAPARSRLPRRRRQLQVDRLPVDPVAGDADAQRARDRRRAATPSRSARRRDRGRRVVDPELDAPARLRARGVPQERGAPPAHGDAAERVRAAAGARDAVPARGHGLDDRQHRPRRVHVLVGLPARRRRPQPDRPLRAQHGRRRTPDGARSRFYWDNFVDLLRPVLERRGVATVAA